MRKFSKYLLGALVTVGIAFAGIVQAVTLQGNGGGTGFATTTVGNVGNCLAVASSSPFLTYTLSSPCGSGGSLTSTYVGFGSSANTLSGDSNFTYVSSTGVLSVPGAVEAPSNPLIVAGQGNDGQSFIETGVNDGIYLFPFISSGTNIVDPVTGFQASLDTSLLSGNQNYQFPNVSDILAPQATVVYAQEYAGSDLDQQIQNAYNACPSVGCEIFLPAGTFNVSTTISIATNSKPLMLMCPVGGGLFNNGGTVLHFTPSNGTTQFTYDVQDFVSAGTGIVNCNFIGPAGQGNIGSSNIGSSTAIKLGGANGAFGFQLNNVHISGYGTGLSVGQNTSFIDVFHSVINKNGRAIDNPQSSGANGENNYVGGHSVIADCNSATGSIASNCVLIQQSGNVQWTFDGVSFDDAAVVSTQFGGTSNVFNFINDHFEDPNTAIACYDRISTQTSFAGAAATVVNVSGGDFMEDKTSGACNEFVTYGGTLNLSNVTGDINNNLSSPMVDFATPLNGSAIISWHGLSNKGFNTSNAANTGFTNVYASFPYSVDGLGNGSTTPSYSFATSTLTFGFNPVDPNGNKYSTSSGAFSGLTAGFLPVATSSNSIVNSNIFQGPSATYKTISFIKSARTSIGSGGLTSSSFTGVNASDLLVFETTFTSSTGAVATFADSNGTPVFIASTTWHGTAHSYFYYEANAAAGTHNVTSTYNGQVSFPDLTIIEYSNVATTSPLDSFSLVAGTGANVASGVLAPTSLSNEVLLGYAQQAGGSLTAGTGYTLRSAVYEDNATSTLVQGTATSTAFAGGTGGLDFVAFGSSWKPALNTTAGNFVGIGTTNPFNLLDVNGFGDFTSGLAVGTTTTSTVTLNIVGTAQITGTLTDGQNNKYSTSTSFGVGPSTSTYVSFFTGASTIGGNSSLTYSGGVLSAVNIESIEYADQFTGADMGAQINNAYAACPSSGCTIYVPAGFYSFTTPILLTTYGKSVQLIGDGGGGLFTNGITTLQYNATSGVAYTYNVQKFSSAGIGMFNLSLVGPAGIGKTGSSTSPTTPTSSVSLGVLLGGAAGAQGQGATGFVMEGVQISGFGKGVQFSDNTFVTTFDKDVINNNGMNVYMPAAANAFENDKFTNDVFGNCNSATAASSSNCVYIAPTASADLTFIGDDFDTAQLVVSSTNTGNVIVHLLGNHFENPGVPAATSSCYAFITTTPGQARFVTVYSSGNTYLFNGGVGGNCPEEVNNGGNFVSSGDTIGSYGDNTTTTINFVINQDSNDTVSWSGLYQTWQTNALQSTNIYGSNALTVSGFGTGSAVPTYSISTSSVMFSATSSFLGAISSTLTNTLVYANASGIFVATSGPSGGSGLASTTPFFSTGIAYDNGGSISASSSFTISGGSANIVPGYASGSGGLDFTSGDNSSTFSDLLSFSHKNGTASGSLEAIGFNSYISSTVLMINSSTNGWLIEKDSRNNGTSTPLMFESMAFGATSSQSIDFELFPTTPAGVTGGGAFNGPLTIGSTAPAIGVTANIVGSLSVSATSTFGGQMGFTTSTLTLSGCGTSATSTVGSDNAGIITVGAVATGCTLNFAPKWIQTPECTIDNQSMSITSALAYTVTTSTIVITQATGLSGDLIDYSCNGLPN